MLEARWICGISGDGNIHAFLMHDCYALTHIIRTVAADFLAFTLGIRDFIYNRKFTRVIIKLCLHISESVDS